MNEFYQNHSQDELNDVKNFLLSNKYHLLESVFIKKFPELYNDICKIDFPFDTKNLSQKLYHIVNGDVGVWELGLCKTCQKRCKYINFYKGYYDFCSYKCSGNSFETQDKFKSTNLKKYGKEYPAQCKDVQSKYKQTCLEKYGVENYAQTEECRKKMKETCILKYNVDNYSKTSEYKERIYKTCLEKYNSYSYSKTEECKEKIRQTCLEKYGVENYAQTEECKDKMKETCLEKYGVTSYTKTIEFKDKEYITKKKNNSFHTSKIEECLSQWLNTTGISYIRQYKDNRYPFSCDFYLPNYDLFIEIQGSWTHGEHPFNENDKIDLEKVNKWKIKNTNYYKKAIYNWTISDVYKRTVAHQNNLNYLEIFSTNLDKCKTIINTYINENMICPK